MAWKDLTLTEDGGNALTEAQTANQMQIKSIVVGDGDPPADYSKQKKLVNQLFEITNIRVEKTEAGCEVIGDFPVLDYDYYFREIGIIVKTSSGEKLYVYDNAGADADHIIISTGVVKEAKRLRLGLVFSDVAEVTVVIDNPLYVDYEDFEKLENDVLLTNTASGTGSVTMPDAADAEVKKLVIKGRSEQEATKGINLLDLRTTIASNSTGLTAVLLGDGGIQLTGTTRDAEAADMYFVGSWGNANALLSGEYSLTVEGATYNELIFLTSKAAVLGKAVGSDRVSVTGDIHGAFIRLMPNTAYNMTLYPMICPGSTRHAWEPYTGGNPAPNPDYPQEIQSVQNPAIVSSIGDRNLVIGAVNYERNDSWLTSGWGTDQIRFQTKGDHYLLCGNNGWAHAGYDVSQYIGQTVTIQADLMVGDGSTAPYLLVNIAGNSVAAYPASEMCDTRVEILHDWKHIEYTTILKSTHIGFTSRMYDFIDGKRDPDAAEGRGYVSEVKIRNLKIEVGNKATPWTPAPEDITPENAELYRPYLSKVDLSGYTFRGRGSIRDIIENIDGTWGVERQLGELIYSDAAVSESNVLTNSKELRITNPGTRSLTTFQEAALSDSYVNVGGGTWDRDRVGIFGLAGTNYERIAFRVPITANKDTYFVDNPVVLAYPLEDPVWEPFSDIIQRQFNVMRTYPGEHSTIYVVSDVAPDIEVEYYRNTPVVTALIPAIDKKVAVHGGDISKTIIDQITLPTEAFPVPAAGEQTAVFAGKIAKFLQDYVKSNGYIDSLMVPLAGWSNGNAPYTQTITLLGVRATDRPVVDITLNADTAAEDKKAMRKAYDCLDKLVTNNGSITLHALTKRPEATFYIKMKGVSTNG